MNEQAQTTILLVDDDPDFRQIMVAMLKDSGYEILEAGSGAEAAFLLERVQPSLIIVDGQLPDVDGIDWIAEQRVLGNQSRIMFVSAYWRDSETYERLTNELDVSTLLHKPVFPAAVSAQIEAELNLAESVPVIPAQEEGLAKTLAGLRDSYAAKLPELTRILEQAVNQARIARGDSGAFKDALAQSHKLRGTAGSYGFQEFAEIMGRLENILHKLLEHPENDALWRDVDIAVSDATTAAGKPGEPPLAVASSSGQGNAPLMARIIMLDDDPEFLSLVEALGKKHMIEILPAKTIAEAERLAVSGQVDAAIIDYHLSSPDFSLEAARTLRALTDKEALPLAFISADDDVLDRVSAAHAGASIFMNKPLDAAKLVSAVQNLVSIGQKSKPRVLMVDDDLEFASSIAAVLRYENMTVEILTEGIRILEHLQNFRPDLLLLDGSMPSLSGFDICRMLRTLPEWENLPILFLTGQTGIEARVATFKAGADDYLAKPVVMEELLARVKVRIERARLWKDRANTDALTGLYLRRPFLEELGGQLAACGRTGSPLTLSIVEIKYSDEAGKQVDYLQGERIMSGVGKLFSRRFRPEDLRGRWSDRQLILSLNGVDRQTAEGALKRLMLELRSPEFSRLSQGNATASFSAGLAEFPADGTTAHALIQAATQRLAGVLTT